MQQETFICRIFYLFPFCRETISCIIAPIIGSFTASHTLAINMLPVLQKRKSFSLIAFILLKFLFFFLSFFSFLTIPIASTSLLNKKTATNSIYLLQSFYLLYHCFRQFQQTIFKYFYLLFFRFFQGIKSDSFKNI